MKGVENITLSGDDSGSDDETANFLKRPNTKSAMNAINIFEILIQPDYTFRKYHFFYRYCEYYNFLPLFVSCNIYAAWNEGKLKQ